MWACSGLAACSSCFKGCFSFHAVFQGASFVLLWQLRWSVCMSAHLPAPAGMSFAGAGLQGSGAAMHAGQQPCSGCCTSGWHACRITRLTCCVYSIMRSLHSKPCWERLQAYAASVLAWQASTTAERGDDTLLRVTHTCLACITTFLGAGFGC